MKKIYLLVTMSLLVCAGLFAQDPVYIDLGTDYVPGVAEDGTPTTGTWVPAASGFDFVATKDVLYDDKVAQTFHAETPTELVIVGGGGTLGGGNGANDTYWDGRNYDVKSSNAAYVKLPNGSQNTSWIDIKPTYGTITGMKINGTDAAPGTDGHTYAVLFSSQAEFDVADVSGYYIFPLPACRSGKPAIEVPADKIPAGARSARIYGEVTLSADGKTIVDSEDAETYIVVKNDMQLRITYIGVTVVPGAVDVKSGNNKISSATIGGRPTTLNEAEGTISASVAYGTDISALPVEFSIHEKATADFVSGNTHNFAAPLIIKVTAENGDVKEYTVSVTVMPAGAAIAILSANGQWESYDTLLETVFEGKNIKHIKAVGTDVTALYEGCNLIFVHSNVGGTNETLMATRTLVGTLPILNMKAYCYTNNRWSWGTPSNAEIGAITAQVPAALQNHNIFKGVSFAGEDLTFYSAPTTVANGIQFLTDMTGTNFTEDLQAANQTLATFTMSDASKTGVQMQEVNLNNAAKYLFIGLSMEGDSYLLFNDNSINILKNAVEYLLNPDAYYDYATNTPVDIDSPEAAAASIYFNGSDIINPNGETVKVYNLSGAIVLTSSLEAISANELPSGIYVAVSESGAKKFVK